MTLPAYAMNQSNFAEIYEHWLVGPLFRPWAEVLLGREMRRVLAPGGRLAVATWRSLEEIPFFMALDRVAGRHLGAVVDHRYGYGDATALEKLLAEAGFHEVRVEQASLTIRFADAAPFVRMNAMALVGMSTASATRTDAQRAELVAAIAKESTDVLPPYADGEGIAFALSTNVATARG